MSQRRLAWNANAMSTYFKYDERTNTVTCKASVKEITEFANNFQKLANFEFVSNNANDNMHQMFRELADIVYYEIKSYNVPNVKVVSNSNSNSNVNVGVSQIQGIIKQMLSRIYDHTNVVDFNAEGGALPKPRLKSSKYHATGAKHTCKDGVERSVYVDKDGVKYCKKKISTTGKFRHVKTDKA